MDPSIGDKKAFFGSLQGLRDGAASADIDDLMDEKEQAHRLKCLHFYRSGLKPRKRPPAVAPASAEDTTTKEKSAMSLDPLLPAELAETTSFTKNSGVVKTATAPALIDLTAESQESMDARGRQTGREQLKRTRPGPPILRTASSSSSRASTASSSGSSKRKRTESAVKLVPEALRVFRDCAIFYIPNDDINPARKARITRAREYGATWVRDVRQATHVIVDRQLGWKDIAPILEKESDSQRKVIANESYPLDCLKYGVLVKSDQEQYRVPGIPSALPKPAAVPTTSGRSDPLEIKKRQTNPSKWDYAPAQATPPRSENSIPCTDDPADMTVIPSSQPCEGSGKLEADELSQCINTIQTSDQPAGEKEGSSDGNPHGKPTTRDDTSDDASSEDERERKRRATLRKLKKGRKNINWQEKFRCMKGGTKDGNDDGPNSGTIALLQKMCDEYTLSNVPWKPMAYRKAIATLREQPKEITTADEAMQLPNIDDRLAQKIEEIARTGKLKRLENEEQEIRRQRLQLFLQVYGVGTTLANKWVDRGFRSLEDLKNNNDTLTEAQRVGVEHYDDLNTRIPRLEVEALGQFVTKRAAELDPSVKVIIGGSYRRGSESSGDIDFIITKRGTASSDELAPFLHTLVDRLKNEGFLTATLSALSNEIKKGHGSKWHGCCVLPKHAYPAGGNKEWRPMWRRIDFLLVPETEAGAALIYFTGNDIFNRSMRLLASKKGMRLNQRGLYKDVIRGPGRVKQTEGELVEGANERRIFEVLGVKWREPHERWC